MGAAIIRGPLASYLQGPRAVDQPPESVTYCHTPSLANSFSRPSDECLVAPGVKHAGVSGKSIKAASLLASSTKTFLPHTTYGTRLHVPDNDTRHNAKTRTTVAQSRALGRLQMKLRKNGCNPGRGDNGPPRLCC